MRRIAIAVLALAFLATAAAACGQKPNVAQSGSDLAAGGQTVNPATGELVPGAVDPATGEVVPGATDGSTTGGAGGTAGGTGGTGGTTGGGAGGGATAAGDRTGITDTEIRIGIHAPVTGAAPIPQSAFEEGKDVFWNSPNGKVYGRKVTVFFEDDKFDPATAVQKCRKMVETDKVFVLIGGGGADQITACARYAQSV